MTEFPEQEQDRRKGTSVMSTYVLIPSTSATDINAKRWCDNREKSHVGRRLGSGLDGASRVASRTLVIR